MTNKYIYSNRKCVGQVVNEYFYTSRSLFGIYDAYFLEKDVIDRVLDMGVKFVIISHKGSGKNKGCKFRCDMCLFIDDDFFISIVSPLVILQRGVKVKYMEKI